MIYIYNFVISVSVKGSNVSIMDMQDSSTNGLPCDKVLEWNVPLNDLWPTNCGVKPVWIHSSPVACCAKEVGAHRFVAGQLLESRGCGYQGLVVFMFSWCGLDV